MLCTKYTNIWLTIETSYYLIKLKTPLSGTLNDVRMRYDSNFDGKISVSKRITNTYYFITYTHYWEWFEVKESCLHLATRLQI